MNLEDHIKEAVAEVVDERFEAVLLRVLPEAIRRATEPEYLGREEAANRLNISTRALDYRLKERRLPHVKRGRRVLIPTSALRDYMDEAEIPARSADT